MSLTPTEKQKAIEASRDWSGSARLLIHTNGDNFSSEREQVLHVAAAGVHALISIAYALQAIALGDR